MPTTTVSIRSRRTASFKSSTVSFPLGVGAPFRGRGRGAGLPFTGRVLVHMLFANSFPSLRLGSRLPWSTLQDCIPVSILNELMNCWYRQFSRNLPLKEICWSGVSAFRSIHATVAVSENTLSNYDAFLLSLSTDQHPPTCKRLWLIVTGGTKRS